LRSARTNTRRPSTSTSRTVVASIGGRGPARAARP
jgi:hypothetical protein